MDQENPTAGDSGASITDRLESYLTASDTTSPPPQDPQATAPEVNAEPTDSPDEGASEGVQEPQVSTADVAKWLGVDESALDVDEDGSIKVKTKIDGKEGAAKFADLLKSYQTQGHADNKSREVAERERALQARTQEVEQQAQARLQHIEQLGNVAAQELMREYQSIDWNTLRVTDPGNYAALKADFQERNAKLQGVFQATQQQAVQRQAQAERARMEHVQEQAKRLPELIPEWKDEAAASKERDEIRSWAVKAGFEAQEIDGFTMAHHVAVMRKAMLYDKLQSTKPAIENKVRTAPKLVKPGQAVQNTAGQELRNLKQSIVKSGGRKGIADYLIASGKV